MLTSRRAVMEGNGFRALDHPIHMPWHSISTPHYLISMPLYLISMPHYLISTPHYLISMPLYLISTPYHSIYMSHDRHTTMRSRQFLPCIAKSIILVSNCSHSMLIAWVCDAYDHLEEGNNLIRTTHAKGGDLPDPHSTFLRLIFKTMRKLKPNVQWADGMPFTAADVKFTYNFIANKETGATTTSTYSAVAGVEMIDPTTVKVVFKTVNPA